MGGSKKSKTENESKKDLPEFFPRIRRFEDDHPDLYDAEDKIYW